MILLWFRELFSRAHEYKALVVFNPRLRRVESLHCSNTDLGVTPAGHNDIEVSPTG